MCEQKSTQYFVSLKNYFFLCIYKLNLISAEGYKNAGVQCLKIRETDELWVGMKDAGVGLGVKSISDYF